MLSRWADARGAAVWSVAIALAIVAGSGCGHRRSYCAAGLPPEFLAPAPMDMEGVNLSSVTTSTPGRQVLQPGDVLEVAMITDYTHLTTSTTPVRVAEDGTVAVPLIGSVAVAGLEIEKAEEQIGAAGIQRGIFRHPAVTVTMKQQRTNRVTVVGAVKQPGVYALAHGSSSLMAALVAAGGLLKEAGPDVEIRPTAAEPALRGPVLDRTASTGNGEVHTAAYQQMVAGAPMVPVKVNLLAADSGGADPKTRVLRDGDVIYVPKRELRPIYVYGLVRKPGEFPYPPNQELRLLDAVALAGGVSNNVADKVLLIRRIPGQPEAVNVSLSIAAAERGEDNLALAPGDTVTVEQTAVTAFTDALRDFFRIGFTTALPLF